jgi:hypothetical protein
MNLHGFGGGGGVWEGVVSTRLIGKQLNLMVCIVLEVGWGGGQQ